jgi:hypothetical protein
MRYCRALLLVFLPAAIGCGGSGVYPAGGKVVFADDTPLPGGVVLCEPVDGEAKVSVRGFINKQGEFRLGTYATDDGAPEGKYRVKIQPPELMFIDERHRPKPSIHARFTGFDTSKLEITVTRGKNDFTLTVEKP